MRSKTGSGFSIMVLFKLFCARRNDVRISSGASLGIVSIVFLGSVFSDVAESGFDCSDFVACLIFIFGIVISGFFVLIISVVVATYNGIADNINNPKTNPPKPRSCARINRCHWAPLNMSKLNK